MWKQEKAAIRLVEQTASSPTGSCQEIHQTANIGSELSTSSSNSGPGRPYDLKAMNLRRYYIERGTRLLALELKISKDSDPVPGAEGRH
jgi:hypothetical protein